MSLLDHGCLDLKLEDGWKTELPWLLAVETLRRLEGGGSDGEDLGWAVEAGVGRGALGRGGGGMSCAALDALACFGPML